MARNMQFLFLSSVSEKINFLYRSDRMALVPSNGLIVNEIALFDESKDLKNIRGL